jgi:autoinducer 2-degrading protein
MIVTLVHIWVKREHLEEFIKASIHNHENSIKEPGNLRFDLLQDEKDPTKFIFYEAYESEKAVADHKNTTHYIQWRDTVALWMAQTREGIKYKIIKPTDKQLW